MDVVIFVALMAIGFLGLYRAFRFVEGHWGPWSEEHRSERPWWGSPWTWLPVIVVLLVLGVFVAPRYLGGVVILLPFVWLVGPRSRGGRPRG